MTPQDKLAALQSDLDTALGQTNDATKLIAKLKAEISALKKLIADQESADNQYAKEYAGVNQDKVKKTTTWQALKDKIGNNTSQGDRDRVAGVVRDVDGKIQDLLDQLNTATKNADDALQTLTKKKAATKAAQDVLLGLKEPWKTPQKLLKDADTLLTAADQQVQAKNYPVAFFLNVGAGTTLDGVKMDKPDDYSQKLSDATDATFDAANDEQAAKDDSDQKTADKNAAQKALDDARAKRLDTIIRRINEGVTVPAPAAVPASAPVTGPAAGGPAVPAT